MPSTSKVTVPQPASVKKAPPITSDTVSFSIQTETFDGSVVAVENVNSKTGPLPGAIVVP